MESTFKVGDIVKYGITLNKEYGKSNFGEGKTAQVEFVSANPTGPLTVGHGRGAILGDVISSILEWNGYKVEREYYFNNAGRQMRKLGESVYSHYAQKLNKDVPFPEDGYQGKYIIDIAEKLIDDIRAEKDISAEKLDYMNEIDQYLKQMRQTYEKVL